MDDILFNEKSGFSQYGLKLVSCQVTVPEQKHHYIKVPCADGEIDAMEGLCGPVYENRTLKMAFRARQPAEAVDLIFGDLIGKSLQIITPDDPAFYWLGTLDLRSAGRRAGDMITLEAVVFPWRYACQQEVLQYPASLQNVSAIWRNNGGRDVIPRIQVTGSAATVHMGGTRSTLSPGSYELPEYLIPAGSALESTISGGEVTVTYRTAKL